jgi:tRNA1(Val) A37 N6-methylase TrmN6
VTTHIKNFKSKSENECTIEINKWMENCRSILNFSKPPTLILNQKEFLLSFLAGLWLLRFFNGKNVIKSATRAVKKIEELKNNYPQSNSLWKFLDVIFNKLNEEMILESLLLVKLPNLHEALVNDTLGTMLQHSLTLDDRKKLAANYTNIKSAEILVELLDTDTPLSIVDPFCGSGRLVSAYLESLNPNSRFPHIRIHDLMPSAVLIAYCRLILILSEFNQDYSLLQASFGDAFTMFSSDVKNQPNDLENYDLVLMNPPFTRTHRINDQQKNNLLKLEQQYGQYLSGQAGLHIYAILLADKLIKENGVLGTVLPAATILSQYSRGVHELLLNNYQLKVIAASEDAKSYSEDSSLREIILIAKRKRVKKEEKIKFLRILEPQEGTKWTTSSIQMIPEKILANEWNWTIFLRDPELLRIREVLHQSGFIKNGKDLNLDVVRGVEMYGPDFFFIPNRKWEIISEERKEIIIKSEENTLRIPKGYLVRSLRKPGNYSQFISPKVSDFALSVPTSRKNNQKWLKDYLFVSEQFASPAKRKYGSEWISHIQKQVIIKKPWGHLFFIDKFGISSTSVMGHFSEKKLICSKNFYVLRDSSPNQAKLLAAWLNSTFFIILFLLSRREIGGSYGRLQIVDYMKEPLFLDVSKCSSSQKNLIIKEFDIMRKLKLPPIPDQLQLPQRKALDLAIIKGIQLSDKIEKKLLNEIYTLLENSFRVLKQRDKARRSRKN